MKKKLLAILVVLLLTLTFGCEAYIEHDKTYESLIGSWNLNCVYVNAHPIEFKDEKITVTETFSGVLTTLQTDENGVTAEVSNSISISQTTDSSGNPAITITKDSESKTYTFSIDTPAQLLHLYFTDAETGDEYHYIYVNDLVEY